MFLLILNFLFSAKKGGLHLHSNMFLLIQHGDSLIRSLFPDLHSNMFLLIPGSRYIELLRGHLFTFQYVSINTKPLIPD